MSVYVFKHGFAMLCVSWTPQVSGAAVPHSPSLTCSVAGSTAATRAEPTSPLPWGFIQLEPSFQLGLSFTSNRLPNHGLRELLPRNGQTCTPPPLPTMASIATQTESQALGLTSGSCPCALDSSGTLPFSSLQEPRSHPCWEPCVFCSL